MIVDCNRLWTQLVGIVYRLRRKPMVTTTPPLRASPAAPRSEASAPE